jgi:parallel beta-helix repeat protein
MMRAGFAVLAICAGLVGAAGAVAETEVGGVICSDTTWSAAGSPYVVSVVAGGTVVVCCDATLTIDPNVQVRFEAGLSLRVAGTLIARGTDQERIRFTSDQAAPAAGDWGRVEFLDQAEDAVFDANGVYVSGCILEHCVVEYGGFGDYGAINVNGAGPYLRHCEVRDNLRSGIYVYGAPPMRIENCDVHDNGKSGIYLYNSGGNTLVGNLVWRNSDSHGGGIRGGWGSGSNTLIGNTIWENDSDSYGGGVVLYSGSNVLRGNVIIANTAAFGGGIAFEFSSDNLVFENEISGNSVSHYGGGIHFRFSDRNAVGVNTIAANSSDVDGGAIEFNESERNVLNGNVIRHNSTVKDGGAIAAHYCDGNVLSGCTFAGNTAGAKGGAMCGYGTGMSVVNCILYGDSAAEGPEVALYHYIVEPSNVAVAHCDVFGGLGKIHVEPGCTLDWHASNVVVDPLLVDPNGGDLRLSAGSPCIDAGDSFAVPRDPMDLDYDGCVVDRQPIDMDGNHRFHDDATADTGVATYWHVCVDMGAYEYGSTPGVPAGPCFGDLNCDGVLDFSDINPFVLALTDPAGYAVQYPGCDIIHADVGEDGAVGFGDINSFVALLTE